MALIVGLEFYLGLNQTSSLAFRTVGEPLQLLYVGALRLLQSSMNFRRAYVLPMNVPPMRAVGPVPVREAHKDTTEIDVAKTLLARN
jgi:hypothetical protein